MQRSPTKDVLVVGLSTALALICTIAAYELYRTYDYYSWKSQYHDSGDWYGKLTVPSHNEIMMWEYRPNGEFTDNKSGTVIRTNKFGFRQPGDTTRQKKPKATRIAFIGDSVTLGLHVSADATFVNRVAEYGRRALPNLETLNFGVDGYNAVQILELLRTHVLGFSPDKVVYVLCLNDFDFMDASGRKIRYFRKPASFVLEDLEIVRKQLFYINEDFHAYHFKRNREAVFQSILDMGTILAETNVEFHVAIVPVFQTFRINPVKGVKQYPLTSFKDYPLRYVHEEIVSRLRTSEIDVIDLLGDFGQQDKPPESYAFDAWHPNEEGHRVIATSLMKSVVQPISAAD